MSQAAEKIILFILGGLLIIALAYGGVTTFDNRRLAKEKVFLSKQFEEYRTTTLSQISEQKNLQDKIAKLEADNNALKSKVNNAGGNVEELGGKIKELTNERDVLKSRYEILQKERDDLTSKLSEKTKALMDAAAKSTQTVSRENASEAAVEETNVKPGSPDDEDYWAKILKAKAALQVDLEKTKDELNKSALEISDLKKQNSDLQLAISKLNNDKEAIAREIKYGNDLAKNLSVELARSQNEKQFMSDRMNKIAEENSNLHEQLKALTSTKVALEKSVVKLQGDKKQIEDKLVETEGVIQNRVDQIYQLKDSLEKDFKPAAKNPQSGEVELSPIIVNASAKDATQVVAPSAGINGSVVSINDDNNFVIVNLGEEKGVKIGDKLNVYRGSEYIANLEIIQVRKDIAAADIKNKMMPLQVGDTVR